VLQKLFRSGALRKTVLVLAGGLFGIPGWTQTLRHEGSAGSRPGRYLLVLRDDFDRDKLEDVVRQLEADHGLRVLARLTEGAVVGLVVESPKVDFATPLATEGLIASSVPVRAPGPAAVALPSDKILRATPGWAIPGLYQVELAGDFGFTSDIRTRKPAWQDPGWRARDVERTAAVYALADELVAEYGGRVSQRSARVNASFGWAMTELQARRVASDPRVVSVSESSYSLIDGEELQRPPAGRRP
jgi:hypothetical protein